MIDIEAEEYLIFRYDENKEKPSCLCHFWSKSIHARIMKAKAEGKTIEQVLDDLTKSWTPNWVDYEQLPEDTKEFDRLTLEEAKAFLEWIFLGNLNKTEDGRWKSIEKNYDDDTITIEKSDGRKIILKVKAWIPKLKEQKK